jgi:hypothetical protein
MGPQDRRRGPGIETDKAEGLAGRAERLPGEDQVIDQVTTLRELGVSLASVRLVVIGQGRLLADATGGRASVCGAAAEQAVQEVRGGDEHLGAHGENKLNQVNHGLRVPHEHGKEKRDYQQYQQ